MVTELAASRCPRLRSCPVRLHPSTALVVTTQEERNDTMFIRPSYSTPSPSPEPTETPHSYESPRREPDCRSLLLLRHRQMSLLPHPALPSSSDRKLALACVALGLGGRALLLGRLEELLDPAGRRCGGQEVRGDGGWKVANGGRSGGSKETYHDRCGRERYRMMGSQRSARAADSAGR